MEQKKNRQRFFLKVVLPSVVTMVLFVAAIFLILIPSFRDAMMMDKKEMIKELSETAWSILSEAAELEHKGELTKKEAQARAISEINGLRYGNDMKDYFWICDMTPKMIAHPYRPELNGKDMSTFIDANNKKMFLEFVNVVKEQKEGYVEYYWQWKDDPNKIVPKLSYVKEFAPWQWIIGTGIYLEDVEQDISAITNRVIIISIIIAIISILLMFLVIYHSHSVERDRDQAQQDLKASKEKYQALVESSSEAFVLILDKKINYANSAALSIFQYSENEFLSLDLDAIIDPENIEDRSKLMKLIDENIEESHFESNLCRKDKTTIHALLSISKVSLQEREGLIIIIKEISAEEMHTRHAQQRKVSEDQKNLIIDLQNQHRLAGDALPDWENVSSLTSYEDVISFNEKFPIKLKALIDTGINIENLTDITSKMVDAITLRFIKLAIEKLGKPPLPFCFIVFGSEGRSEQTLVTDQDNAIIYNNPTDGDNEEEIKEYFLSLGTLVCDWLNDAGYHYCKGGNMAKNSKWILSVDEWESCFGDWIYNATPSNLLRINIFFDFRPLYGESTLADNLWSFIDKTIESNKEFLLHFVNDALLYKPPITLFGNIALKDKDGQRETFSIKEVICAIVQFARIYALQHKIKATNTLKRLELLKDQKLIKESTYREISEVYKLLMNLRFKHQAMKMQNGNTPDNRINPKLLTDIEREILKKSFTAINSFQTKISYDFKGVSN